MIKNDLNICPQCNNSLENGYIISLRPIHWSNDKPGWMCKGRYPITGSRLGCNHSPAKRCPQCKIIILNHL